MKRYGFQVAVVTVGVLLGWLIAVINQGGAAAPATNAPAVAQERSAPGTESIHFSAASPEGGATITEETKDPAVENLAPLVPRREETPWLKPVLMGVGALFVGAIVIGVAARRVGIQDPGVAALEQDQKDAEFDEKHDEQPLKGPEAGNGGGAGHGHGGQAHR